MRPSARPLAASLIACATVCYAASVARGATEANTGNPLWTVPLNTLTETRERPLFAPSRRPTVQNTPAVIVASPPPAPTPAAPEQPSLRLLGTIAGSDSGIAICLNPATNEVVRVRTGESFEGWALRAVRGREATFEKFSRQAVLTLPSPDDPQAGLPPQIAGAQPYTMSPVNTVPGQTAPPTGNWRDGDGNLIAPPKR